MEQRIFMAPPEQITNAGEPHMALLFLLDTSRSMSGPPIAALNDGLNRFKSEVCKDEQAMSILDVAIVEFNSRHRVVQEFKPIEQMEFVNLVATGGTNMSAAISESLRMVVERTKFYRKFCEPYKPWVVLISDGAPSDDITGVAQEIKVLMDKQKVSFRSLGVEGYDSNTLHKLSPNVTKLEGTDFTAFFDWINKSMAYVSQSSPGEKPQAAPLSGNVTRDYQTDDMD